MNKILFAHSYFLHFDPKQKKLGQVYPPLGTLYAAAVLREAGYLVSVFDTMFCTSPDEISSGLQSNPDLLVIYDDGFNYLTKMCLTNMREAAFRMIELARKSNCKIIVCSSDAVDHFVEYLEVGADVVIIGEGEQTLVELVQEMGKEKPLYASVPGIAYKEGSSCMRTTRRALIKDLDSIPMAAWDLIDLQTYKQKWLAKSGYFSLNVATTRGCPYKCNWCAKPIYGNHYHARSPKSVALEIAYLQANFGIEHVWFCDDIFGLKPGWVEQFAIEVKTYSINVQFKIQSRADLLSREHYVAALKRAGCRQVWLGAESGSQRILNAMDKGITIDQISTATMLLKKYSISPCFFIQFGYLGEKQEDIKLTIAMIRRLLPAEIGISVSYPLPGTKFYELVKRELKGKANWTDSDDLALMFRNTYQPAYYRRLHRYVHQQFHIYCAFEKCKQLLKRPLSANWSSLKKVLSAIYYLPLIQVQKIRLAQLQKL